MLNELGYSTGLQAWDWFKSSGMNWTGEVFYGQVVGGRGWKVICPGDIICLLWILYSDDI